MFGGTGFICSHLVEELIRLGMSVTCLIRTDSARNWLDSYPVKVVESSCFSNDLLRSLIDNSDYIFHLDSFTRPSCKNRPLCDFVGETKALLDVAYNFCKDLKRLVYLGNPAIFEDEQKGFKSQYPKECDKHGDLLEIEETVLSYMDILPLTILRPPAVYGPRDRDFYHFFKMVKKGLLPYQGKSFYSMIYVEDLVKGVIKALNTNRTIGKAYYLSHACLHSNIDIADAIAKEMECDYIKLRLPGGILTFVERIAGRTTKEDHVNLACEEGARYSCWLKKCGEAKRDFGFEPEVDLNNGIKWTVNWYKLYKWL